MTMRLLMILTRFCDRRRQNVFSLVVAIFLSKGDATDCLSQRTPSQIVSRRNIARTSLATFAFGVNKDYYKVFDNTQEANTVSPQKCRGYSIRDSFNLVVFGDLHMEDDMSLHEQARDDCLAALEKKSLLLCPPVEKLADDNDDSAIDFTAEELITNLSNARAGDLSAAQLELLLAKRREGNFMKCHLVSLGDLGRKDIRHLPGDAGTTKSFVDAKAYFDSFNLPYELVTGNHDLEGLDEFDSDEDNLDAWMNIFKKDQPQFCKLIGEKTLIVGMSTVRFRDAPYSSHEVHINDEQLKWFLDIVRNHSSKDGWKIFVFSHAPIMGSGLRVLQNVHVVNGCAWLNHCSKNRSSFIRTVMENPQIKLWFSGHFHLSHDYEDAISSVGSCTFVQVGVVGQGSTRDGRRQSRIIQGCSDRMKILTVNHHKRDVTTGEAEIRLDAEVDFTSGIVRLAHDDVDHDHENWFSAYIPEKEDGCYLPVPNGQIACSQTVQSSVCWWHMADGAVLGLHEGQLVEYDPETLSPLGIVISKVHLAGREVLVLEEGKALLMVGPNPDDVEVVHPNGDGSYWRKVQRNKRVRQEEKAREEIAKLWLKKQK